MSLQNDKQNKSILNIDMTYYYNVYTTPYNFLSIYIDIPTTYYYSYAIKYEDAY